MPLKFTEVLPAAGRRPRIRLQDGLRTSPGRVMARPGGPP